MDPNQNNLLQSWLHFMQNYHHPDVQNSQLSSSPTNPNMFYRPQMNTQGGDQHPNFQNSQLPSPPTNFNMFYRPQINAQGEFTCFEPQIPIGPMPACQVPQFSTQVGFKNTIVEEGEEHHGRKKSRELFTMDEDTLLIQSWLNVSKDSIIGVDQKADGFWLRIATNYNEYRGQLREKTLSQLKSRWHRINGFVQKFVGCYKQAVSGKKSGSSKKDIMIAAHAFYSQDTGMKSYGRGCDQFADAPELDATPRERKLYTTLSRIVVSSREIRAFCIVA
uniref:Uncharacterized protein LOC113784446 n=1 Tax=Cicer arietinum TaxID=3827 RepID=A0A3Q7Y6V3_CICAR|nr:uncharacterized protein LOC113784446 [Cicer arietinum]